MDLRIPLDIHKQSATRSYSNRWITLRLFEMIQINDEQIRTLEQYNPSASNNTIALSHDISVMSLSVVIHGLI